MATPRGPKPRLSREEIVARALVILERDGREALNLRALARELGMSAMGLYRYFENKDALLDAMVGSILGDISVPADLAWDARLRATFAGMYAAFAERAGGASIAADRRPGAVLDPLREELGVIAREAGFGEEEGGRVLRALASYTLGFALVAPRQNWETQASFDYGLDLLMDSVRERAAAH